MSVHTEWCSANMCYVDILAPGEYEDEYGSVNDRYVIVLGSDSDFVIEGTLEEIKKLLQDCRDEILRYERKLEDGGR